MGLNLESVNKWLRQNKKKLACFLPFRFRSTSRRQILLNDFLRVVFPVKLDLNHLQYAYLVLITNVRKSYFVEVTILPKTFKLIIGIGKNYFMNFCQKIFKCRVI